jgi:hypothetical protein
MKRMLMIAAMLVVGASSGMAQGTIQFGNIAASQYKLQAVVAPGVTNVVGTAATAYGLGPASVEIQLLVGGNGDPLSTMVPVASGISGQTIVTNTSSTASFAQGTFSGGLADLPTGYAWSGGLVPIQFAYVAWSISNGGTDYTSFFDENWEWDPTGSGYAGWSGVVTGYYPGQQSVLAPQTFGTSSYQIPCLLLEPIPEPAAIAMAGLGAAVWLLFRRGK